MYDLEPQLDFSKIYKGRDGLLNWVDMPHYSGFENDYMDLGVFMPYSPWSTVYIAATIKSDVDRIARLSLEVGGMAFAMLNGQHIIKPTISRQCNMEEDNLFISLKEGNNTLLIKALYLMVIILGKH